MSRPRCADPEAVRKYEADREGGPNQDDVLIAWYQPLSSTSAWNWDAITILAEKAQALLKSGDTIYDHHWLTLPILMQQIAVCLKEMRKIMAPSPASLSKTMTVHQRRRYRKSVVRTLSYRHDNTLIFSSIENSESTPDS
jgi:hypothetical protein